MISSKVVHFLEDDGLPFKDDLVELHLGYTSILLCAACAFKLLFYFLLYHQAKLFGVVDGVLYAFYLAEDLLFIRGQGVFLGVVGLTDPVDLRDDVRP